MSLIFRVAANIRHLLLLLCLPACFGIKAEAQAPAPITLEFDGSKNIGNDKLLDISNKCRAEQSQLSALEEARIDYCLGQLKSYMRARGYLQATVGTPLKRQTEAGFVLTVPVNEGHLYRLGVVHLSGAEAVPIVRLLEMLNLKEGDVADGEVINKWLFDSMKTMYNDLGYIQYTADVEPYFHLKERATEGTVDLDIHIDEGRRFRVGSIRFSGQNEIPEEFLLTHMLLRTGDMFNSQLIRESIKRIEQTNLFAPIDADKDIDYDATRDGNEVNLTIHLRKNLLREQPTIKDPMSQ